MEWLGRSSDRNPFENLWDDSKNEADKKVKEHTSLWDLYQILQLASANLDQQCIRTLVNSMHKRCLNVIEKYDEPTITECSTAYFLADLIKFLKRSNQFCFVTRKQ